MSAAYSFSAQVRIGDKEAERLDAYFSEWFGIIPATKEMQTNQIDRIFERAGIRYSVEYKSDIKAAQTGNVFIETLSVDTSGAAGWAPKSLAQILVTYIPDSREVIVTEMMRIKDALPAWALFRGATSDNGNYKTHGILVPISELRKIARRIRNIKEKTP